MRGSAVLFVLCCLLPAAVRAQLPAGETYMMQPDSVQRVLKQLQASWPGLVGFIPETGRRYITRPRASAMPEDWLVRIQDAFYYDTHELCRHYGRYYLADWRALASKAARETFWGCSYLCNRSFNYFGIRHRSKPWICNKLGYCGYVVRHDPEPAAFAVFSGFERSLWIFVHTIYSPHFLERLPDGGQRIADVIEAERQQGSPYWQPYRGQPPVPGYPYTAAELIYTWSEHPINNLCVSCTRATDHQWVNKIRRAEYRAASAHQNQRAMQFHQP